MLRHKLINRSIIAALLLAGGLVFSTEALAQQVKGDQKEPAPGAVGGEKGPFRWGEYTLVMFGGGSGSSVGTNTGLRAEITLTWGYGPGGRSGTYWIHFWDQKVPDDQWDSADGITVINLPADRLTGTIELIEQAGQKLTWGFVPGSAPNHRSIGTLGIATTAFPPSKDSHPK